MQENLSAALWERYQVKLIRRLGGGFYADVYLVENQGENVVLKIYRKAGLAQREALQLGTLGRYAILPMPKVLWAQGDALMMNYLPGENAGVDVLQDASARDRLGEMVVEQLVIWHNLPHPEGFGELDASSFCASWQEYYRPRAEDALRRGRLLAQAGQLDSFALSVMEDGLRNFDQVFGQDQPKPGLVHGDYNLYNVLCDPATGAVTAIIDPFACHWADPELDLYQLENATGPAYQLLERYGKRRLMSPNAGAKLAFYELFSEIEHYHRSGWPVIPDRVRQEAQALRDALENS